MCGTTHATVCIQVATKVSFSTEQVRSRVACTFQWIYSSQFINLPALLVKFFGYDAGFHRSVDHQQSFFMHSLVLTCLLRPAINFKNQADNLKADAGLHASIIYSFSAKTDYVRRTSDY